MTAIENWRADRERYAHRAVAREPVLWAVAVYRFGQWGDELSHRCPRALCNRIYGLAAPLVEMLVGISIPKTARIGPGLRIFHGGGIVVHEHARIGARCTMRQGVTVGERREGGPVPLIGDDVEFGAYAQVLGGIVVGDGASIGALTVVLGDVPALATAVGVPARIARLRHKTG